MKDEFIIAYITTATQKEAKSLGRMLVKERLAGCINIIPRIESMYWWKGKMEHHAESVLIAKTRRPLFRKMITFVKRHHRYAVPCIDALPILDGNPDYLKWLNKETGKQKV